jgi:RNA polymerase sigma-70 factor (ECF subfamily)
MAGADDEEAIRAVLDGDIERYAELVDRYQAPVLHLALGFLHHYDDAQDVAQDAFLHAYRALGRFRGRAKFSTWLYRIVVNECKQVVRRRAHRPIIVARVGSADASADGESVVDAEDPRADVGEAARGREFARRVDAELRELSMRQRTAFILHHRQGLALEEVAAVMGCRVGTAKAHVFRATATLRRRLQDWALGQEGS